MSNTEAALELAVLKERLLTLKQKEKDKWAIRHRALMESNAADESWNDVARELRQIEDRIRLAELAERGEAS